MKRFLFAPAFAAVVIFVPAVFADDCVDGWCKGGCDAKRCVRVRLLSRSDSLVTVELSNNRGIGKAEYNCDNYMHRFIRVDYTKSDWNPTTPGSASRATAEVACTMK